MGHSQAQIDAIASLITIEPMPPVSPMRPLTPRADALEMGVASLNLREFSLSSRAGALETITTALQASQATQDTLIAAHAASFVTLAARADGQDAGIAAATAAATAERLRNNTQDTNIAALGGRINTLESKVATLEAWRATLPLRVVGEVPTLQTLTTFRTAHPPLTGTLAVYVGGVRKTTGVSVLGSVLTIVGGLLGAALLVDYDYAPGT